MTTPATQWTPKMGGKNSLLWFDYPSDFYTACDTWESLSPHKTSQRKGDPYGGGGQWAGTKDWATADLLAKKGWKEGVDLARPLAERLSTEMVASLVRPEIHFDVTGDMFDIGRVVMG